MSSLVRMRRTVSQLLPRLIRSNISVSPHCLLSLQQLQQRVQCDLGQSQVQQVAAVHSRAQQAVRQQEPPAEAGGEKFKKLEEKLVRFLENIDSSVRTQDRVLKFQVENSIKIIKALGHCSSNQALLLLNCHGEVMVDASREERTRMLNSFVELIDNYGVKRDISHYNCILKVHHENRSGLTVTEFLDSLPVAPNRVTYQHCVALLCQQENIAAANQLIEERGLLLNESVLLSLLSGHCIANDSPAISSTLQLLEQAGVPSNSSQVLLLMANCFAEKGNPEKLEETMATIDKEGIKLSDGDILRLVSSCCHGGLNTHSQTEHLISRLKTPNFDSLRNFLPTFARAGNLALSEQLYVTSLKQKQRRTRSQQSGLDALDGLFLIRAMLESDRDIISVLNSVKKIQTVANNKVYMEHLVLESARIRPESDCVELIETIKKDETLDLNIDNKKVEEKLAREFKVDYNGRFDTNTLSSISTFLKNLKAMDQPVPFSYIGNNLIPGILDLQHKSLLMTAQELRDLLPFINWSYICNLVMASVLRIWTEDNMKLAANFILNVNMGHAKPNTWKVSLARSYMKTGNVDLFTNIIVGALKSLKNDDKDLQSEMDALFGTLYYIRLNSKNDELIVPLLEELVRTKIGIPPSQATRIASLLSSTVSKDLLETAAAEWENRDVYWTREREEAFLEERRDENRIRSLKQRGESRPGSSSGPPYDMNKMIWIQKELEAGNEVNGKLADSLIKSYLDNNEIDKALGLLSYSQKNRDSFFLSPSALDLLVERMIEARKPTLSMVLDNMNEEHGRKIYISTLMNSLSDLARQGQHQQVIQVLETFNPDLVLMEKGMNASSLLNVYSEKGDVKGVEEIFTCLVTKGLGNTSSVINLVALIDVHLSKDDMNSAVAEFLRLARLYKKMPRKFELTCKLIMEEDIQGIQAILDASIEIIGETKSLYDLTYCFLSLGKKSQGRKLFETAGLSFDKNKMSFIFDKLIQSGNLQACEDLVEISKSIFASDLDFMYHRLVLLYKNDKDKVREIARKIEEENIVPSYILKKEIDQILSDGKATANEPQNLDAEVTRAVEMKEVSRALDIVMESFESGSTSLKCKRDFLDSMIYSNNIPEAQTVATKLANSFPDPEKITFTNLYYRLLDKLRPSKKTAFLLSLNQAFRKVLRDGEMSYSQKHSLGSSSEKDTEVLEAFESNDMSQVISMIATKEPSVRTVNNILHKLLKEDRLEEADQVGEIVCQESFLDRLHYQTQSNIHALLKKYQDRRDLDKIIQFVGKMSPKANLLMRGEIWIKASMIKSSPDRYIEYMVEHQHDSRKWMVNTEVLLEAVDAHPSLPDRMEELSSKGFTPATTMLAKLRLAEENMEEFERLVLKVPVDLLSSKKGGMFDRIDTREKMQTTMKCMKNLRLDRTVLNNISNCYLSINKKSSTFGEMVASLIDEDGLKIRDISKSLLVRLGNDNTFKYQTEVRKFLESVRN